MPLIFINNVNNLFLKRYRNNFVKLMPDMLEMNFAESLLADNIFLDQRYTDQVNISDPLMDSPKLTQQMPHLTRGLSNLLLSYPWLNAGVFIWDYNTGKYVTINADKPYSAASIIKIPILFQLFKRAEKGLINLDDSMSMTEPFIAEGSGELQYSQIGTAYTYRHLAKVMIQQSDNTATNMLLASIGGMNELNRVIRQWGLGTTHMSNWLPDLEGTNVTTPMELGRMLYNLDNPDFFTINSRAEIVQIMGNVRNRNLIQRGLPENVEFLHKTGDIGAYLGDAGIVMLPNGNKYIIAIVVKRPWNDYSAKELIIEASEMAYRAISTQTY